MKLICGLGNPGREYEGHRHNIGFQVVDALAARFKFSFSSTKFDASLAQGSALGERLVLLKPQTFMNLSGTSVGQAMRFFKVAETDVLVVHDELDLPFGKLALKNGGGSGGHNGLKSIAADGGSAACGRLRFGIGKPEGPNARERVAGYVLSNFSSEERLALDALVMRACDMAEGWVSQGMAGAMNAFNRRA